MTSFETEYGVSVQTAQPEQSIHVERAASYIYLDIKAAPASPAALKGSLTLSVMLTTEQAEALIAALETV